MPTLNDKTAPIRLLNKKEEELAIAEKVVYGPIKGKGEPFPKSATVVIHGVETVNEGFLPDAFDILAIEDDGVVQKRIRILNCTAQGWVDGNLVAIATAPDTEIIGPREL